MTTGVCIQIGIGFTPEYIYLVEPNWKRKVDFMHPIWQIPQQLIKEIDNWVYYGIDSDPYSLAFAMRAHQNKKDVTWVNAYISDSDKPLAEPLSELGVTFHAPVTTFDAVLDHLKLTQIDLLAIDIEGDEINLFESYSWRYLPKYIAVEVHGNPPIGPKGVSNNVAKIASTLSGKHGYRCLRKIPTNIRNNKAHTIDMQLIRD